MTNEKLAINKELQQYGIFWQETKQQVLGF
jgi:hypothetical protein